MRLRNWLLTGTSLAALAILPGTAFAQQAEYQALLDAQASGDSDAIATAQQALTEACIVAGYSSIDECIAAINGGGAPAAAPVDNSAAEAEAAAQAEAEAAAAAQAEADAAAAAQAEADAQAAAQAEADAQAAAAAQAEADAQAAAAAQAEADAQAAAAAQAEADAQAAAAAQAEADAAASAQAEADAQAAAAAQAEADAAAAAQAQADADAQAAADAQAQFVADLQAALDAYQAALNQAAAGDYAAAAPAAAAAEARILELCTTNGYPDIASCIGQELPPLPEQPTETPAEVPTETPAEQPAEVPAETPAEQEGEAGPTDQPADAGVVDPIAAAQDQLGTAVELYNVGIAQLEGGDAAGQSTIDAANRQFAEICATLGNTDVAACLAQYGITLPPVPQLAASPVPEQPPLATLPGADVEVTPDAVEVLPEAVVPEEAAPVLDSAKDFRIAVDAGAAPVAPPVEPTEPPPPPPVDDRAAQADIAAIQVVSPTQQTGEAITFDALPAVEVPQNVTIINNVTNVTNITNNTTTNNTTINNNGGQQGGNNQGGNNPGPRPGQPGQPNYTNSGFIFNIGVNLVISNPAQDFDRIREDDDDVYYERLPGGRVKETIERPNGVQIVTIRDRWGNVLQRSRIMPDGREYILAYYDEDDYEDEDYFNNWRDPGDDLPPLRLTIPIRDYIIDADYADEDEVENFFREPPVEQVRRIYTVEDVKRSARLRDSVRRIEVGSLTFDSGAATISRTQVGALSKVANAMLSLLEDNPGEVFLIEGHTDAVGSDQSNLILSDARAATVARILTDFYDVPPENLVTQGYGERYLKVKTTLAEPLNRRVAVKRITPLITVADRN